MCVCCVRRRLCVPCVCVYVYVCVCAVRCVHQCATLTVGVR